MHLKTGDSPQTYTRRPTNIHLSPRIILILSHYFDPKPFKRCFLNILNNNREPTGPRRRLLIFYFWI